MAPFDQELIATGFGSYHINRFRICLAPGAIGTLAKLQNSLLTNMTLYMDPDTATVRIDPAHPFEGRPTLMFYGIPVIRPFDGPIAPNLLPPGLREIAPYIPKRLRGLKMPAIHTDSVGVLKASVDGTGFTVQTLKRNFPTGEDQAIRKSLELTIDLAIAPELLLNPALIPLALQMKRQLIDYAVWVNQHHFLAGRRSFRFVPGAALGYTDGRIVFETAAVERYAKLAFAAPTEAMMGGDKKALEVVWVEMVARVAGSMEVLPPRSNHPNLIHDKSWRDTGVNKQVIEFYQAVSQPGNVASASGNLLGNGSVHPLLFVP